MCSALLTLHTWLVCLVVRPILAIVLWVGVVFSEGELERQTSSSLKCVFFLFWTVVLLCAPDVRYVRLCYYSTCFVQFLPAVHLVGLLYVISYFEVLRSTKFTYVRRNTYYVVRVAQTRRFMPNRLGQQLIGVTLLLLFGTLCPLLLLRCCCGP